MKNNNENILLLAAKLEREDIDGLEEARRLIALARKNTNGARSWLNSIKLELQRGSL